MGASRRARTLEGELVGSAGGSRLSAEGAEWCHASGASASHILPIREKHL